MSNSLPDPAAIEIRRAQPDDDPALQDFIARTYGDGAQFKGSERWRWQFLDNPATRDADQGATMWLAFMGETVVGQMGVQDCQITVGGQNFDAAWIVDVMVDEQARGMGLGHSLHSAIMTERPVLMTLTMAEATRRIAQKAGCITLGPTRQWMRLHNLSGQTVARYLTYKAQYGTKRKRLIRLFNGTKIGPMVLASAARLWTKLITQRNGKLAQYRVEEFETFGTEIKDFIAQVQTETTAYVQRSGKIPNWRYSDIPDIQYYKFLIKQDGEIRGCLLCRPPHPSELPAGIVTDIIANKQDTDAHDALLELAQSTLNENAQMLEAAASTPEMSAALKRAGFIPTRTMRPTIVCTNDAIRSVLEQHLDDWHFTKADHDWDQIHPV